MSRDITVLTGYNGFIGKNFLRKIGECETVEQETCWHWLESFKDWHRVKQVIHQGAISSTVCTDVELIHQCNTRFTILLFELCAKHDVPVIKYASSASVYGMQDKTINPLNFYAISKVQVDYWVQQNIHRFPVIQGFRYFNVFGDGEEHKGDQSSPVSKFRKQIAERGYLELFENSHLYERDFVCVDDVVDLVLQNDKPSGIYDLGTSKTQSFQTVAESVVRRFGGEIRYIPFPEQLLGKYQTHTCAEPIWGSHQFKTIDEYLAGC